MKFGINFVKRKWTAKMHKFLVYGLFAIAMLNSETFSQESPRSSMLMRMLVEKREQDRVQETDSGMWYSENEVNAFIGNDSIQQTGLRFYIYNRFLTPDQINVGVYYHRDSIEYAINLGFQVVDDRTKIHKILKMEYDKNINSGTHSKIIYDTLHDVTWNRNDTWYHSSLVPITITTNRTSGTADNGVIKIQLSQASDDENAHEVIKFPSIKLDRDNQLRFIEQLSNKTIRDVLAKFDQENGVKSRGDTIYVAEWVQEYSNGSAMLGDQFLLIAVSGKHYIFQNGSQFIAVKSKKPRKAKFGSPLIQNFRKIVTTGFNWKYVQSNGISKEIPEFEGR